MAGTGKYWSAVLLLGFCLSAKAQNTSNKGREFWITFTSHINVEQEEFSPPEMALYITSDISTSGTVSIPGQSYTYDFNVRPNEITVVPVPRQLSYTATSEQAEAKGIYVSAREPVVVYSHIYGERRSGATLVMPLSSLGQEYRAVTYSYTSQFTVIAAEDDTWVEITPAAGTEKGAPAGVPFKIRLRRGEVYQVRAGGDLTGSKITTKISDNTSCKKIAVYSGSLGVSVGCGGRGYDNLYQQLFAGNSWGRNYVVVPMKGRPYDLVRILAGGEETMVSVNGASHLIAPGSYLEISPVTGPLSIVADRPVCVAQFTSSQDCDPANPRGGPFSEEPPVNPGDPDMVILSPIEQNLRQITLYSSSREAILASYINVIIGTADASTFTIDGAAPAEGFTALSANPAYSYTRISVRPGTHRLSAGGGFNAIAYGFGDYESYAYLAGTNILDLGKRISHTTGPGIYSGTEGCSGRTVAFSADLDFEALSFQWDFGDGQTSPLEDDPARLKRYEHTYSRPGDYEVKLIILKSDGSECGDAEKLEVNYQVSIAPNPMPEPLFSVPAGCVKDEIPFENLSTIADGTEMTYRWDFGDGSAAVSERSPRHRFPAPGSYQVSLLAVSQYGCRQEITREVTVNAADPLADFTFPDRICRNEPARFFDQSSVSFGEIIAWEWDFNGEGTSIEKDPEFLFGTDGLKKIRLKAFSGKQCFMLVEKELLVLPVPEVRFELRESRAPVCASDPPFRVEGYSPAPGYQGGQGFLFTEKGLDENGLFDPAAAGPGTHEIRYVFTNTDGCSETVSQYVRILPLPEVNAGADLRMLKGTGIRLNVETTGIKIEWSPAGSLDNPFIARPYATPEATTDYTVSVTSGDGCVSTDQVRVQVLELLTVPNAFSPNNDGVNDAWTIEHVEDYPGIVVQVYNRFGRRVFYSKGYSQPWTGDGNEGDLPPATYYYVIQPDGVHPPISGSLTIIR